MSELYYASFSHLELNRIDVLDRILDPLHQYDASVDVDLYELQMTSEGFEYTFKEIEHKSLWEGINLTMSWDGVEFHFTLFERDCSYMLLNEKPGQTAVVFTEPKRLFEEQLDSEDKASELLRFLSETMEIIGAEFCIFEPGWTGRSKTTLDVERWASEIEAGIESDWKFALFNETVWPHDKVMNKIGKKYKAFKVTKYLWIAVNLPEWQVWLRPYVG